MDIQVRELQTKAMNGDEQALELYNQYVEKGVAPRIHVKQNFKSSQETMSMMAAGYTKAAEERGDDLFTGETKELTREDAMKADPATRIAYGYTERAQAVAEHKEKRKAYRESTSQGNVISDSDKQLSALEKLSKGYGQ